MDFKNAPKKRTSNFREDETKLLIQLWGSPTVQNKLYLTHRKAPVMRLIAANMQKHGFYRTPDEIKTRIRNLKCLYHRIKKSMTSGVGIGTVDPDWPHYKAMDDILSKKNAMRQNLVYNHNLLSEVQAVDVKEEIEDIDITDDGDSNTSNSNGSDDEFEETSSMPLSITPLIIEEEEEEKPVKPVKIAPKPETPASPLTSPTPTNYPRIQIAQNLHAAPQNVTLTPKFQAAGQQNILKSIPANIQTSMASNIGTISSKVPTVTLTTNATANKPNSALPFPLLILNGTGNGMQAIQNGIPGLMPKSIPMNNGMNGIAFNSEVSNILKEILDIQKENLKIEKERLKVEKQKLEFERAVGSQLLTMVPMFNEIFQKFKEPEKEQEEVDSKHFAGHPIYDKSSQNSLKRTATDPPEEERSGKIFRESVVNDIRKGLQESALLSHSDTDGDSGIANDSI